MSDFVVVARTNQVPPGQLKTFVVNGQRVLIANWEGTFFATQDLCTHDGGTLGDGELVDGEIGHAVGPCLLQEMCFVGFRYAANEAEAALTGYPVMRAMSMVYPEDPAWDTSLGQYMLGDFLLVSAFAKEVRLPQGEWIGVEYADGCVVEYEAPQVVAIDPGHDGWVEDHVLICPWHGWRYDVRDGTTDHPRSDVKTYPVAVRDGEVFVTL